MTPRYDCFRSPFIWSLNTASAWAQSLVMLQWIYYSARRLFVQLFCFNQLKTNTHFFLFLYKLARARSIAHTLQNSITIAQVRSQQTATLFSRNNAIHFFLLFTAFPCPFSVQAITLFIYCTSVPAGTEARTEEKEINKDVA